MTPLGQAEKQGTEVQILIVADTETETREPPPIEPPPPPVTDIPTPPPPVEKPEMPQIVAPMPKATPAPKRDLAAKPAPAPQGAKKGPTPQPGQVDGNVTKGETAGTPGGQKIGTTGWRTPRPPYPPAALASRIQGKGSVRISTDASGKVTSAVITGPIHSLLDVNTRSFALGNWKGPPNQSITVPVIYQIR